jgi:hypothetical protein
MRIGGKMHYLQSITGFTDFFCARPQFLKNLPVRQNQKKKPNFQDFDKPSSYLCKTLRELLFYGIKRQFFLLFRSFQDVATIDFLVFLTK